MRIEFSNEVMTAVADTRGAELVSVVMGGRERLWQNETGTWAYHAPILFPICGKSAVRVNGKEYPIAKHGFARVCEFELKEQRKNAVTFELRSNEETMASFPYPFLFRARYSLLGARLRIVYEAENPADNPLYVSCGGHESFAIDRPLGEYELRFPLKERFASLLNDEAGRLTGETQDLGSGTCFPLPEDILTNDGSIIFGNMRSRRLTLCERGGKPVAELKYSGFPHLLLWRTGDASMICIEPWHNLPDTTEPVELSDREGMVLVPPHQKVKFTREITYF